MNLTITAYCRHERPIIRDLFGLSVCVKCNLPLAPDKITTLEREWAVAKSSERQGYSLRR